MEQIFQFNHPLLKLELLKRSAGYFALNMTPAVPQEYLARVFTDNVILPEVGTCYTLADGTRLGRAALDAAVIEMATTILKSYPLSDDHPVRRCRQEGFEWIYLDYLRMCGLGPQETPRDIGSSEEREKVRQKIAVKIANDRLELEKLAFQQHTAYETTRVARKYTVNMTELRKKWREKVERAIRYDAPYAPIAIPTDVVLDLALELQSIADEERGEAVTWTVRYCSPDIGNPMLGDHERYVAAKTSRVWADYLNSQEER